jgi:hypothetical protein
MNWDAAGAIGEIVGAAAVVISLIYLAAQIRTQNAEARLAAVREISVGFRNALTTFTHGDLGELFARANEDYDSLTNGELIRLISALYPMFRVWEEAYIQFERGRLEPRIWEPITRQFGSYFGYPAFERVWHIRKQHMDKSFREYADSLERAELRLR